MKLFNAIVGWDVYVCAENEEDARAAVKTFIMEGLASSYENAIEAREARHVRAAWTDQSPLVGAAVSDQDFESVKGKTTMQVQEMLYTKQDKKA